ncbi:Mss4-like protein [Aspergillus ambiguus]|uniref:GFA family protein n=1 Tax=Aspergillus ambiguus TaxID=176160 RepID=UPI003CCE052B
MAVGGCFCGNIRVEFSGQPTISALCHCSDCRKITGTLYSYSFVIKGSDLEITGSPKEIAKVSDSGNHIKNYFCPDCGTPLYGLKVSPSGVRDETVILRAGIFDDIAVLNQNKPQAEIYVDRRVGWINCIENADQFEGMPRLEESDEQQA